MTSSVNDTIYISRGAVRKEEDANYVVVLDNGAPMKIPIETGIENAIHTQVISGLEMGQKVILADWEKILAEAGGENNKGSSLKKILWMIRSK